MSSTNLTGLQKTSVSSTTFTADESGDDAAKNSDTIYANAAKQKLDKNAVAQTQQKFAKPAPKVSEPAISGISQQPEMAADLIPNDLHTPQPKYSAQFINLAVGLKMTPEELQQKIDNLEADADAGDADAQLELGKLYYLRNEAGDRAAGAEWISNAARYWNQSASKFLLKYAQKPYYERNAQFHLAMAYPLTKEFDQPRADLLYSACEGQHPKAFAELKKAADAEPPSPYSLSRMGKCYARGVGVAKNLERAIGYFTMAADLSVPGAQQSLEAAQAEINSQSAS